MNEPRPSPFLARAIDDAIARGVVDDMQRAFGEGRTLRSAQRITRVARHIRISREAAMGAHRAGFDVTGQPRGTAYPSSVDSEWIPPIWLDDIERSVEGLRPPAPKPMRRFRVLLKRLFR